MTFNAIFNNISVISWRSFLLLEEIGVPGESHRSVACHFQTLTHNAVSNIILKLVLKKIIELSLSTTNIVFT